MFNTNILLCKVKKKTKIKNWYSLGHHMGKQQKHKKTPQARKLRGHPLHAPEGNHKVPRNRQDGITNTNIKHK